MRENRDALPLMPLRDLIQRLQKAPGEGLVAFAALHRPALGRLGKQQELFRLVIRKLAEGNVLPDAHADLAETRLSVQSQPLWPVDRARRGAGADKIAGINGVDGNVLKALFQRFDLAQTIARDGGIIPAVCAAENIALGLGVSNQINRCHKITVSSIAQIFRPAKSFCLTASRRP